MLWACVLLPHLALDTVLRRHPAPDQPLALVTGPLQRRVLSAVNAAAAAQGLHRGQSVAAAEALCGALQVIDDDPARVARTRDFLAAWAYRYSSQVSLDLPGALVLEVEGSLGLFGPWPAFEARLRDDLRALGFRHRIAMAPTAAAAAVLARHQDGLAVTTPGVMHAALSSVPVAQARLPGKAAAAFERMAVRRLGQVLALPRASLGQRHGPALLSHLDQLLGHAPETLALYRPPDAFDEKIELNYDVESSLALLFPLRRLTADLAAYLAGRDGGVSRFVLRLGHEDREDTEVVVGLLAPERQPAMLFELARGRLERVAVPAPVRTLRLLARELPPFVPAARELFEARPQQSVDWPSLRERLRARLGNDAVYGLEAVADHRPERSWKRRDGIAPPSAPAHAPPAPRPTWLLPRPVPLHGRPLRLLAGPERIESGWWDGGDVQRDYYVVETAQGQRAWAYCAAGEHGPYMLHGWFA
ncbi:Y-family DNA polymerase [Arenimonas sp. MALMAid1274]|uniref:Y-family DNA polymerase n=1 Tax=Arenimonas sp. MALMAid1274 TaxID=3411630 RepID=UPI003BA27FE1